MTSFHFKNPREHVDFARALRKKAPSTERLVWNALREMKADHGLKFRRQHPLHLYVADFACVEARLVIEIDGMSHDASQKYDAIREAYLCKKGWTIIRFSNEDVIENLEGVVLTIVRSARELTVQAKRNQPSPGPAFGLVALRQARKREGK